MDSKFPEVKNVTDENGDVVTRLEYDGRKLVEVNFSTVWRKLLGRFLGNDQEKGKD
jgi:hypothetical protein